MIRILVNHSSCFREWYDGIEIIVQGGVEVVELCVGR